MTCVYAVDMDFRHFVVLMWYYCTVSNNLHALAFSIYDVDGNGILDAQEAEIMLRHIYGKYFESSDSAHVLTRKIGELGRDGVTKLLFIEFCKRNPQVLEPAQKNINLLIKSSLGAKRWLRMSEHRKLLTKDKFVTIWDLIVKIQEKAGDDSDLFNVREAVAHRAVKEKKRLKKKYSQEYLEREDAKNRNRDFRNSLSRGDSLLSRSGSGDGSPGKGARASDVVMIMDDINEPAKSSSSPVVAKRKGGSKSPSKKNMVVPTA